MEQWLRDGLVALGGLILLAGVLYLVALALRRVLLPIVIGLARLAAHLIGGLLRGIWQGLRVVAWPAVFMLGWAAVAAFLGWMAVDEDILYYCAPLGALVGLLMFLVVWVRDGKRAK